ncbi:S-adenosyl-L-methionine-dependent methyltransferase [Cyathus striatus]|nr:S-adenosyl-L-methionine-dependent methyltransferase [Cyathus striatus]
MRVSHSYPGAAYILPADDGEKNRLVIQHQLLNRMFGANILAPVTWKEGDKVLDACTGTAIWSLEVAKEIPEYVLLKGIDIETRQFPAPESRPKNLELSVNTVISLPSAWTDTFTLVHQRLLVEGLRRTEWPEAVKELHRVTRPGGWAELCEFTGWFAGPINDKFKETLHKVYNNAGLFLDCGKYVECMMRDAGFVDIHVVEKNVPLGPWGGEDGRIQSENLIGVWRGIKPEILKLGESVDTEEELDGWLDEVEREYNELEGTVGWVVCYGRKAS